MTLLEDAVSAYGAQEETSASAAKAREQFKAVRESLRVGDCITQEHLDRFAVLERQLRLLERDVVHARSRLRDMAQSALVEERCD
ncbi:hypothetical protein RM543_12245 [Roseicyclus sp. F158]|uniref:Uncharacterized protein n=1 Tax=Tropicimonas omnivorans TaxID=3075590 RepID=A0ABU3DIR4_9RHOB|nr:hypothetical protein [Roseicyclus sp. F158]MDT0683458.1 hypothetical protein [Roseicyclus sp. F158]